MVGFRPWPIFYLDLSDYTKNVKFKESKVYMIIFTLYAFLRR